MSGLVSSQSSAAATPSPSASMRPESTVVLSSTLTRPAVSIARSLLRQPSVVSSRNSIGPILPRLRLGFLQILTPGQFASQMKRKLELQGSSFQVWSV